MSGVSSVDALELEVLRNPTSVKTWLQLARALHASSSENKAKQSNAINVVYERAIRANGFSYKLWVNYINFRRDHTKDLTSVHEWFRGMRNIFERAVEKLPMMPLLWISFIELVMNDAEPPRLTVVRHVVIRALQALPLTQHRRIWKITRQWVRRPYIPLETAKYLWKLCLLYDNSGENQREYFAMLWEKGSPSDFISECADFLINGKPHKELLDDMTYWETIRTTLGTKIMPIYKDFNALEEMINLAVTHCASPVEFRVSYAVFLIGQGKFLKARQTLRSLLEDTNDMQLFPKLFNLMVTFEDEIIDSLVMDTTLQSLDEASYRRVCEDLFGIVKDPLEHLITLTDSYPLLLNQLELRVNPRDTTAWLKRVELLQEMVCIGRSSSVDIISLYRQAITQCTSGQHVVDAVAAQLYESFANYLWENGSKREAFGIARDGAWHINFSDSGSNMLLMGLQVEFALLEGSSAECLEEFLLRLFDANPLHAIRTKGLVKTKILTHLKSDCRAWILAIDLAFFLYLSRPPSLPKENQLEQVVNKFISSGSYTGESACYVASRFYHSGQTSQAFHEFERSLTYFKDSPLVILFLLQNYLSCLCISFGEQLPLFRLRELTKVGLEVAQTTILISPVATVEFLMNCCALESRLGLAGNVVSVVQQILELVLEFSTDTILSISLMDTAFDITLQLQGTYSLIRFCAKIIERNLAPKLIQRVALWWASVEKRVGNLEKAHAVMEACCKSQNPRSSHGIAFWNLWESICSTVDQFEQVNKRKQQVILKDDVVTTTSA